MNKYQESVNVIFDLRGKDIASLSDDDLNRAIVAAGIVLNQVDQSRSYVERIGEQLIAESERRDRG